MTILVLVILCASMGGAAGGTPGAVLGAAVGYSLGSALRVNRRLDSIEETLARLEKRGPQHERGAPEEQDPETSAGEGLPPITAGLGLSDTPSPPSQHAEEDPIETRSLSSVQSTALPSPPALPSAGGGWNEFRRALGRLFTGGNLLVRAGILVLFVGVAFLLKYAAEQNLMPIELRLAGAAAGAVSLLVLGWRLRGHRHGYALTLQGGGVGVLYLTVFSALRIYELIPPAVAFTLLVLICALSAVLSILQNAPVLAVFGVSGGFLAPILTSQGGGSHLTLFSYYALLNAGILGIAWFKAWRSLNLVGFVFTFGVGALWGLEYYRPVHFSTTEPFLLLFFGFYLAVSILFALRQPPQLKGYVDGSLVFGTPFIAFGLQALLVKSSEHGLAWSAFGAAVLYLLLARILLARSPQGMKTLAEAFLALGVVFATLILPLAFDNRWTIAGWAMEGAGMVWVGMRQNRPMARRFGLMLQVLAGMLFWIGSPMIEGEKPLPFLNGRFSGTVAIGLAGLVSGHSLHGYSGRLNRWERFAGLSVAVWGLCWWYAGGILEVEEHVARPYGTGSLLAFFTCSSLACDYLARRFSWPLLFTPALGLPAWLALCTLDIAGSGLHPFGRWGGFGWPLGLAASYGLLYKHDKERTWWISLLHAMVFWIMIIIAALEARWMVSQWVQDAQIWGTICLGLIPSAMVLAVIQGQKRLSWPLMARFPDYVWFGAGPVVIFILYWTLEVNFTCPGNPWPLVYLPILNPLDVALGTAFVAISRWILTVRHEGFLHPGRDIPILGQSSSIPAVFLSAGLFLWLNAIVARTVHHWAHVPFSMEAMTSSLLFQATLSVVWSLLALCTMVAATRRGLRRIWITGAGLMAVVVLKLFLVDLSGTGTIERIVSFIVVGILLLIVGYLSPVPPR